MLFVVVENFGWLPVCHVNVKWHWWWCAHGPSIFGVCIHNKKKPQMNGFLMYITTYTSKYQHKDKNDIKIDIDVGFQTDDVLCVDSSQSNYNIDQLYDSCTGHLTYNSTIVLKQNDWYVYMRLSNIYLWLSVQLFLSCARHNTAKK